MVQPRYIGGCPVPAEQSYSGQVTTRDPVDDPEVLSFGADGPSRGSRVLVLVVAAACLAIGFVAGARWDRSAPGPPSEMTAAVSPVAAGTVTKLTDDRADRRFQLRLFNPGERSISATVVALPGWAGPLAGTAPSRVPAGSWGMVSFEAPRDCGASPWDVRVVQLRLRSAHAVGDQVVPLQEPAFALRDHFTTIC
jgi:hypothetical protein